MEQERAKAMSLGHSLGESGHETTGGTSAST